MKVEVYERPRIETLSRNDTTVMCLRLCLCVSILGLRQDQGEVFYLGEEFSCFHHEVRSSNDPPLVFLCPLSEPKKTNNNNDPHATPPQEAAPTTHQSSTKSSHLNGTASLTSISTVGEEKMSKECEIYCEGGDGITSPFFMGNDLCFVSQNTGAISLIRDGQEQIWGNSGGQPSGATVGDGGAVYVADFAHTAVLSVNEDGTQEGVVKEYEGETFKGPNSIIFDSRGNMYFTDSGPLGETTLQVRLCILNPESLQLSNTLK